MVKRLIWLYQEGCCYCYNKQIGYMGDGEVFGELALLLDQKAGNGKSSKVYRIDRN